MPRAKFSRETRRQLEAFGLSAAAIDELDRIADMEHCMLVHQRDVPDSKTRRKQLKTLSDQLKRTLVAMNNLDESVLRRHFDLWGTQLFFEPKLKEFSALVDKALEQKGSSGNTVTDLDVLVYEIAKVMVKHGVKPKRKGTQFRDIVSAVFQHVGEDPKSIEAAVKKAWGPSKASPRRASTIDALLGLPDDYDWERADSEIPED